MNKILQGDSLEVLKTLESKSIDCIITSPPYWGLRDYGVEGQLGLESTFNEYINNLIDVFSECKRVLKSEGTLWINLGDSYGGSGKGAGGDPDKCKESWNFQKAPKSIGGITKSLYMIPSRFAIAMTDKGWILRNDIIWHKPNCMPESAKDRFTNDYEHLFFFVKNKKYYFKQQLEPQKEISIRRAFATNHIKNCKGNDAGKDIYSMGRVNQDKYHDRLKERVGSGESMNRNKRTVWTISTQPNPEAHFATFPIKLIKTPIDAGCPEKGIVLDPFCGTGTTCYVAKEMGRNYIGIELNSEYIKIAEKRLAQYILSISGKGIRCKK